MSAKHILLITSSPNPSSLSSELAREFAEGLSRSSGLPLKERDLSRQSPGHLSPELMASFLGKDGGELGRSGLALSEELISELEGARSLVIAAPMHNFGVPSTLKAWVDHVSRAGRTFKYGPAGPEGLLKGRDAVIITTSGGAYSEGPAAAMEHAASYLRAVLGFLGVEVRASVQAEGLAMGEAAVAKAMLGARARLADLAQGARA